MDALRDIVMTNVQITYDNSLVIQQMQAQVTEMQSQVTGLQTENRRIFDYKD